MNYFEWVDFIGFIGILLIVYGCISFVLDNSDFFKERLK